MESKYNKINLDTCKLIKKENEIEGDFISVKGEYIIPGVEKTGFFKKNGLVVYEANNDENARELLASEIMELIGMPHADILIAENEETKGCFSLNILDENEELINLDKHSTNSFNQSIQDYIDRDLEIMKNTLGADDDFLIQRREYILKVLFVCALLNNQDIKIENMLPVRNVKTNEIRNAECYDFAAAFSIPSEEDYIVQMSSRDLMINLYKNYYDDIKELATNTYEKLTKKKINEIMEDQMFKELFSSEYNNVKNNIRTMIKLNEDLYIIKKMSEFQLQHANSICEHGITLEDIKSIYNSVNILDKDLIGATMKSVQNENKKENENNEHT